MWAVRCIVGAQICVKRPLALGPPNPIPLKWDDRLRGAGTGSSGSLADLRGSEAWPLAMALHRMHGGKGPRTPDWAVVLVAQSSEGAWAAGLKDGL
jgi:hypothetical protein